jgi:hypothetical protein
MLDPSLARLFDELSEAYRGEHYEPMNGVLRMALSAAGSLSAASRPVERDDLCEIFDRRFRPGISDASPRSFRQPMDLLFMGSGWIGVPQPVKS